MTRHLLQASPVLTPPPQASDQGGGGLTREETILVCVLVVGSLFLLVLGFGLYFLYVEWREKRMPGWVCPCLKRPKPTPPKRTGSTGVGRELEPDVERQLRECLAASISEKCAADSARGHPGRRKKRAHTDDTHTTDPDHTHSTQQTSTTAAIAHPQATSYSTVSSTYYSIEGASAAHGHSVQSSSNKLSFYTAHGSVRMSSDSGGGVSDTTRAAKVARTVGAAGLVAGRVIREDRDGTLVRAPSDGGSVTDPDSAGATYAGSDATPRATYELAAAALVLGAGAGQQQDSPPTSRAARRGAAGRSRLAAHDTASSADSPADPLTPTAHTGTDKTNEPSLSQGGAEPSAQQKYVLEGVVRVPVQQGPSDSASTGSPSAQPPTDKAQSASRTGSLGRGAGAAAGDAHAAVPMPSPDAAAAASASARYSLKNARIAGSAGRSGTAAAAAAAALAQPAAAAHIEPVASGKQDAAASTASMPGVSVSSEAVTPSTSSGEQALSATQTPATPSPAKPFPAAIFAPNPFGPVKADGAGHGAKGRAAQLAEGSGASSPRSEGSDFIGLPMPPRA